MDDYFTLDRLDDDNPYGMVNLEHQDGAPKFTLKAEFAVKKTDGNTVTVDVYTKRCALPKSAPPGEKENWVSVELVPKKLDIQDDALDWYGFTADVDVNNNLRVMVSVNDEAVLNGGCRLCMPVNAKKEVDLSNTTGTPRLFRALNSTYVKPPAHPGGAFDGNALAELLDYLGNRLLQGPEAAWRGPDGLESLKRMRSPDSAVVMEERWARLITQMLVLTPYSAPSQAYQVFGTAYKKDPAGGGEDSIVMAKVQDGEDPGYPLALACQQLCSMAIIARGFRFPHCTKYPDQLCGLIEYNAQTARDNVRKLDSNSVAYEDFPNYQPAAKILEKSDIGPCAVFARKNDQHVAFLLRTKRDRTSFQFFDTGGMATMPRPENEKEANGNYVERNGDYRWVDTMACDEGFNVNSLNRTVTEADLVDMMKARPLGFARLLVLGRGSSSLLFATPLLSMHGSGVYDNFWYSSYFWSLRQVPYQQSVDVFWAFYTPLGDWARELFRTGRDRAPFDMWNSVTPKPALSTQGILNLLVLRNLGDKAQISGRSDHTVLDPGSANGGFGNVNAHVWANLDRFSGALVDSLGTGLGAAVGGVNNIGYFHGNWPNARKQLNL